MSVFDEDQAAMLDVYLYETNSLFEQLDTILIRTEKSSTFLNEDINSIFRIMHTTKSSSSMMNLPDIATLMHSVEDLFSIFRDDLSKLKGNETKTFDLLFAISDYMHHQLEHIKDSDYMPEDTNTLKMKTQELAKSIQTQVISTPVKETPASQKQALLYDIYVRLIFEKDSRMENIRAYMITSQIKALCHYLEHYPKNLENDPHSAEFIQEHGFYLHCETQHQKQVLEQLHRALFVEKCELIEKKDFEAHTTETRKNTEESIDSNTASLEPSSLISVHVSKLDQLQNLTGELMIAESSMITRMEELGQKELLQQFERSFHKILLDMEEIVMTARLVPIAQIVPKLNRVIRDICRKEHKDIDFTIKGEDIEIDKEIVDSLFDPLMHLLRNAVDHGIEPEQERIKLHKPVKGRVNLTIENANGEIVIRVEDDGRGIDMEKIRKKATEKNLMKPDVVYSKEDLLSLILLPGFSTNKQATEFSGRGVGMDVVKNMTDRFKGHIAIQSTPQKGSCFTLYLPLTLTIIESLLFRCGNHTFSIPTHHIHHLFAYDKQDANIQKENQNEVYLYKDKILPIYSLHDFFQIKEEIPGIKTLIYVESSLGDACLIVDSILGYQHIVDKPLPFILGSEGYA